MCTASEKNGNFQVKVHQDKYLFAEGFEIGGQQAEKPWHVNLNKWMKKNDDERRCVILAKMKKNVQNVSINDNAKNPNARR